MYFLINIFQARCPGFLQKLRRLISRGAPRADICRSNLGGAGNQGYPTNSTAGNHETPTLHGLSESKFRREKKIIKKMETSLSMSEIAVQRKCSWLPSLMQKRKGRRVGRGATPPAVEDEDQAQPLPILSFDRHSRARTQPSPWGRKLSGSPAIAVDPPGQRQLREVSKLNLQYACNAVINSCRHVFPLGSHCYPPPFKNTPTTEKKWIFAAWMV